MNLPTWFRTPLAASAGVILGMAALAIPLRQLTSAPVVATGQPSGPSTGITNAGTPSWLSLKLLDPATSLVVRTPAGQTLWSIRDAAAGTHEIRLDLPITGESLELILSIEHRDPAEETAAFLTIAPDGRRELTRHAIGRGQTETLLPFLWD